MPADPKTLSFGASPNIKTATIDVDLLFETRTRVAGTEGSWANHGKVVPLTCEEILRDAKTKTTTNFLATYKLPALQTNLQTFRDSLKEINPNSATTSSDYSDIEKYLQSVEGTQLPVLKLVSSCLSEADSPDTHELKELENKYEESKARYEGITSERDRVSYYEGWFPIFRPMKELSIFILFGISMLIMVISILLILHVSGINIQITLPTAFLSFWANYLGTMTVIYSPYLIGGGVVGIIFVFIAFMRGWI
jgi:hypothetical protein